MNPLESLVHSSNMDLNPFKILILEDEENLGLTLVDQLKNEKFDVVLSQNLKEARAFLEKVSFDLVLLDVMLPDGSGFDIAREIRSSNPMIALIFLTALNTPEDRILGLELGAEDYIVKPFYFKELLLRIKNCLKRSNYFRTHFKKDRFEQVGKARIYFSKFQAWVDGMTYSLTHKEMALLKLLVDRRGEVISRDEILDQVWSQEEFPTPRTVDNFIMRLRRLVEVSPEDPKVIRSVRGIGYQLL